MMALKFWFQVKKKTVTDVRDHLCSGTVEAEVCAVGGV